MFFSVLEKIKQVKPLKIALNALEQDFLTFIYLSFLQQYSHKNNYYPVLF